VKDGLSLNDGFKRLGRSALLRPYRHKLK